MLVFRHLKAPCSENEAQNFNLPRSGLCLLDVNHDLYIFTLLQELNQLFITVMCSEEIHNVDTDLKGPGISSVIRGHQIVVVCVTSVMVLDENLSCEVVR